MNFKRVIVAVACALIFSAGAVAQEAEFTAALDDPAWDGIRVPQGQQCSRKGGEGPLSPSFAIRGIPEGANAIIVEFNDKDYRKLSAAGGHGTIGMRLAAGQKRVRFPAVPEGTTDLPADLFVHASHRGNFKKPGYYAPCSGGRDHRYEAVVKAVKLTGGGGAPQVLAQDRVALGRY